MSRPAWPSSRCGTAWTAARCLRRPSASPPGSNAWHRTSLIGGAYAGLQIRLDGDLNVFKLGIEAGVNGHYAIGEWAPATGVHKRTPAPPDTMQAHNFWFAIGPQFHY